MARNSLFDSPRNSPQSSMFESDFDTPDPWGNSQASQVQGILGDVILPDIYSKAFNLAGPVQGKVSTGSLLKVLQISGVNHATIEKIMLMVVPPSRNKVTRAEFNVALTLVALSQRNMDVSIENVVAHKADLPPLALPGLDSVNFKTNNEVPPSPSRIHKSGGSTIDTADPWRSSLQTAINASEAHRELPSAAPTAAIGSTVPDTPTREDDLGWIMNSETINVTLQTEKEGFILKHTVYVVESPSRSSKVSRRYSDFWWLMETFHKKYPFRLLPSVPPKRLGVSGYYLSADDSTFLEKRRRGLQRFVNAMARHPILKEDALFIAFLTETEDLSVWRKNANVDTEEESLAAATKEIESSVASRAEGIVSSGVPEDYEERVEKIKAKLKPTLENYRTMATLIERMSRRYEGQATDLMRYSLSINSFCENDKMCFRQDCEMCHGIHAGLRNVSSSFQRLSTLVEDQAQSVYDNALESLKRHRDLLASLRELFGRRERLNAALESSHASLLKKISSNKTKATNARSKVESLSASLNGDAGAGGNNNASAKENAEAEVRKLEAQISSDEHEAAKVLARQRYGRQCVLQEIIFWHRQQSFVSLLYQDMVRDAAGRIGAQERAWKDLYGEVSEMPV